MNEAESGSSYSTSQEEIRRRFLSLREDKIEPEGSREKARQEQPPQVAEEPEAKPEEDAADKSDLNPNEVKVLLTVNWTPGLTRMALYAKADIHNATGGTAIRSLLSRGMVEEFVPVRNGRGGKTKILVLSPLGEEECMRRNVEPVKLKGRGKIPARLYAYMFGELKRLKLQEVRYDSAMGEKHGDVVFQYKDGRWGIVEVICSGSLEQNFPGLVRGGSQEGIDELWVICDDEELLEKITVEMANHEDQVLAKKCSYLFAGELVNQWNLRARNVR